MKCRNLGVSPSKNWSRPIMGPDGFNKIGGHGPQYHHGELHDQVNLYQHGVKGSGVLKPNDSLRSLGFASLNPTYRR